MDAEVFDELRVGRVLAAPVAEAVPGDLRRTSDEEFETPELETPDVGRDDSPVPKFCGRNDAFGHDHLDQIVRAERIAQVKAVK